MSPIAEAKAAMSRHVAIAVTAVAMATGLVTGVSSAAPGQQPPTNLTAPTISGTAQVGRSLSASVGTWSGKRLSYAYRWLRCDTSGAACVAIAGAAASSLTLVSADAGRTIRVMVIASNRYGSAAATSAQTPVVTSPTTAPPPPPPPSSSGIYLSNLSWTSATNGYGPVERDMSNGEQAQGDGKTITLNGQTFAKGLGTHGSADVRYGISGCTRFQTAVGVDDEVGSYGSVTFQVYLDGAKAFDSGVMTGTSATKSLSLDATAKSELRLVVTNGGNNIDYDHADWAGASVTCATATTSSPTSPSVTSPPTISGTAQQGQTLTASTGNWSGSTPMIYAYQWQRCSSSGTSCSPVSGATASYLLSSTDVNSTMRVSVTATNSVGSATASSAATAVVGASSVALGSMLFGKDFEDGTVVSGGWVVQDSTTVTDTSGIHRGKVYADNTSSSGGTWSGRLDLPAYTSGRTAAELLHARMASPGVDDYYAQAFKFNDFAWGACDGQGLSLAQYNYEGINGAPLALNAQCATGYGSTATTLKSVYLLVNSGSCASSGCPYYSGTPVGGGYASRGMPDAGPYYVLSPGNVQLNVWYQVVIHVRWTTGTDGIVEAWIKKKGDSSFTKAFSSGSGFPTLQWGGPNNVSVSSLSSYGTNDKFGAYRGPDSMPLKLWQDSFCRATSFDAAASCLR